MIWDVYICCIFQKFLSDSNIYKLVLSDWWITKRRDQPQLSHQGINGQQDGRLVHTAIVRGWALLQSVWDQECRLCTFFAPTTSVIWITSSIGLGTFWAAALGLIHILISHWLSFLFSNHRHKFEQTDRWSKLPRNQKQQQAQSCENIDNLIFCLQLRLQ